MSRKPDWERARAMDFDRPKRPLKAATPKAARYYDAVQTRLRREALKRAATRPAGSSAEGT